MRAVLFAVAAAFLLAGCVDDSDSKIPIADTGKPITPTVAVRTDFHAEDVVGRYQGKVTANPTDEAQGKLIDLASKWVLELKEDGKFAMDFTVKLEGSYTVNGNMLTLTADKQEGQSMRELEKIAKSTGTDTKFIEQMRNWEFKILDDPQGRFALLMVKGKYVGPGALRFERGR
jgi:hypothetical protein